MVTDKSNNLDLWGRVEKTNPSYVKEVNLGKRKFSAICAQSQLLEATREWGPYGTAWGIKDLIWGEVRNAAGEIVEITLQGTFSYPGGAFPLGTDLSYKAGNESRKKLLTDLRSKALSMLGFNADVFMGAFDGNRYDSVNTSKAERDTQDFDTGPDPDYNRKTTTPTATKADGSEPTNANWPFPFGKMEGKALKDCPIKELKRLSENPKIRDDTRGKIQAYLNDVSDIPF